MRRLIKFNYDCKVQWERNSSETLSGDLKISVENELQHILKLKRRDLLVARGQTATLQNSLRARESRVGEA